MFSCEVCEMFKNTSFYRTPVAASKVWNFYILYSQNMYKIFKATGPQNYSRREGGAASSDRRKNNNNKNKKNPLKLSQKNKEKYQVFLSLFLGKNQHMV